MINKNLRFLIYSHFYYPSIGGVERHTDNLAKLLINKGYTVTIVTQIGNQGIEIKHKITIMRKPSIPLLSFLIFYHDIIHIQGFNIFVYLFAKLFKKRIVWYHHTYDLCSVGGGTSIYKGFFKTLEPHLRRSLVGILLWLSFHISRMIAKIDKKITHIVTTYYMLKGFREFIRSLNWHVIYNPVLFDNLNQIPLNNSNNDENYILLYGRMMAGKGEDVLIKALNILKDKGIIYRAIICGPSPSKDYPNNLIKFYRLENQVVYVGPQTTEELVKLITRSSIVVVPSTYEEMFGQTAIEAMYFGKPVIASKTGGLAEVVSNFGVLIPPNDPYALAEAIHKLMSDKNKIEKLGKKAKEYAKKVFAPENYLQKYLKFVLK
jgi:glycosyltransferase involved in cell wall biosynthesis